MAQVEEITTNDALDLSNYTHLVMTEGVCGGRPTIRGTRIEPRDLCMYFNVGQVQFDFPDLKTEEIMECFHYFVHCV